MTDEEDCHLDMAALCSYTTRAALLALTNSLKCSDWSEEQCVLTNKRPVFWSRGLPRPMRGQHCVPGAVHQVGQVPDDQDPVLTAADDSVPLHSGAQHLQWTQVSRGQTGKP